MATADNDPVNSNPESLPLPTSGIGRKFYTLRSYRVQFLKWGVGLLLVAGAALFGNRLASAPASVLVCTPEVRTFTDLLVASGRLRALRTSNICAEITGVVRNVPVDQGYRVNAGDVLVTLDDETIRAELLVSELKLQTARGEFEALHTQVRPADLAKGQAIVAQRESTLRKAKTDYLRLRSLLDTRAISNDEFEKAQRNFEEAAALHDVAQQELRLLREGPRTQELAVKRARIAEAEAESARLHQLLAKHTIRSPFNGLVTVRTAEPGQGASLGQTLITLANTDTLEIYVETDELNLKRLKLEQTATIIPPAHPEQAFQAVLKSIESQVDSARGVIGLHLTATQYPSLPINTTVDVNIETQRLPGQIILPATALVTHDGKEFVYVLEQGRAKAQPVKILGRSADWLAVEGLDAQAITVKNPAGIKERDRLKPRTTVKEAKHG